MREFMPTRTFSITVMFARDLPDVLERPANPERRDLVGAEAEERSPAERDAALVGGIEPREDVEERRLSRAVRPDDRRDARLEREVHRLQRGEAAEPLGHPSGVEEGRHLPFQVSELSLPPAGRQDALGAEDHHEDQDDAEDHPLVLGRLELRRQIGEAVAEEDRKSTRLNSSHTVISYAVFCLKKKK